MDKVYERINWENEPSVSSPINATNLNKIDYAVDELDNRVISLDTTKISKAETASDIVGVSLDEDTGIFTFTRRDGSTIQFDTKLEKVAVNWTYDSETEKLVLTLDDGTTQEVDLSKLITVYEFLDSDTVAFSINSAGKVVAIVKNGAITEEHLAFDYLGEIKVESAKAETASASASVSAQEAKQYRDEAKTFRDETEAFAPDGYDELKQQVAENSARIDAVIELSAFQIQNTASGSPIHLTDSANGKNVGFGLYGKAEQKQYSGKNLLKYPYFYTTKTDNGITFTDNGDGSIGIKGTNATTEYVHFHVQSRTASDYTLPVGTYIINGCTDGIKGRIIVTYLDVNGNMGILAYDHGNGATFQITEDILHDNFKIGVAISVYNDVTIDTTFYPMIRLASITDDTYEPYVGGIASPNPDYPQEITVSGSDGSVEVVSCGKNLLEHSLQSVTNNGVSATVGADRSIKTSGTTTASFMLIVNFALPVGKYILSGCPIGGSSTGYNQRLDKSDGTNIGYDFGNGLTFELTEETNLVLYTCRSYTVGTSFNNLTFYPMIRLASDTDSTYQPYTETTSTIPTPNGLCGIKVSSGGNYVDENGQQWIADEIVKYADGSGKRIQRVGKVVFDGSDDEGWLINTTSDNSKKRLQTNSLKALIKNTTLNTTKSTLLCDKFIATKPQENYNATNGIIQHNGSVFVYSDYFNTNDVTLWTAYLAENPMTVLYELETPTITDLTAEEIAEIEKLYTFYPITNISNDADCGMSITYMADAKNYIDNRLALIESAMLNNI